MTHETLKEWIDATMPLLDRISLAVLCLWILVTVSRLPWLKFFAWLAAPSMGSLIFISAFCIAAQSLLSEESAYKYVPVYVLFALKFLFGTFGAGFIALKAYRITPADKKEKQ